MTEYVLAITTDGTTDWLTTSRSKVNVVHVDFDDLSVKGDLMLDEIKSLARKVQSLPASIPQKEQVIDRLLELLFERQEVAGAFC